MSFSCSIQPCDRLIIMSWEGSLSMDEIDNDVGSVIENEFFNKDYHVLVDLRECFLPETTTDDLKPSINRNKEFFTSSEGKTAFVVQTRRETALVAFFSEFIEDDRTVKIFHEYDNALDWLMSFKKVK